MVLRCHSAVWCGAVGLIVKDYSAIDEAVALYVAPWGPVHAFCTFKTCVLCMVWGTTTATTLQSMHPLLIHDDRMPAPYSLLTSIDGTPWPLSTLSGAQVPDGSRPGPSQYELCAQPGPHPGGCPPEPHFILSSMSYLSPLCRSSIPSFHHTTRTHELPLILCLHLR